LELSKALSGERPPVRDGEFSEGGGFDAGPAGPRGRGLSSTSSSSHVPPLTS